MLHTIQHRAVFDELVTNARFRPKPEHEQSDYREAYLWMLEQMSKRLPTRGDSAIWFWAQTTRQSLLESAASSEPGEVLLTCSIPRERVLVSRFDDWHNVLNRSRNTIQEPGESDDVYDERWNRLDEAFMVRLFGAGLQNHPIENWPDALRREMEETWLTIFNSDQLRDSKYWQATTHELLVDDVVRAVELVGPRRAGFD